MVVAKQKESSWGDNLIEQISKDLKRELENALIEQITNFLLELGSGFAFVGRQYKLLVGGDEFFIDLLFYHIKLKCYIIMELKTVKFKPEFAGQLNFYVSAVDGELKEKEDNLTLQKIDNSIGVNKYQLVNQLPTEFKSSLLSIEEIEAELKGV